MHIYDNEPTTMPIIRVLPIVSLAVLYAVILNIALDTHIEYHLGQYCGVDTHFY